MQPIDYLNIIKVVYVMQQAKVSCLYPEEVCSMRRVIGMNMLLLFIAIIVIIVISSIGS